MGHVYLFPNHFSNTSKMRYNQHTLKFWQIGYRIFHGKYLCFMAGLKNFGHILADRTSFLFKPVSKSFSLIVVSVYPSNRCPQFHGVLFQCRHEQDGTWSDLTWFETTVLASLWQTMVFTDKKVVFCWKFLWVYHGIWEQKMSEHCFLKKENKFNLKKSNCLYIEVFDTNKII
jgi:hypothetical protein